VRLSSVSPIKSPLVRPCGDCRRDQLRFWRGRLWAEPRMAYGDRSGLRSHHCLSLRARSGDADVDDGGRWRGARSGVLIKNAEALERIGKVNAISWTRQERSQKDDPKSRSRAAPSFDATELLRIAASVEQQASILLPKPSSPRRKTAGLTLSKVTDFDLSAGKGVDCQCSMADEVTIGHAAFPQ
jgi:hypothetical protein